MFKFRNVLAGSYQGGSVIFSAECLLSGVGNRVCVKDLTAHSSFASSFETVENVEHILPMAEDDFVIVIDKGGRMVFVNARHLTVLATVHLGGRVSACAIHPRTRTVAVAVGNCIHTWRLPSAGTGWQFARLGEWLAHGEKCRSIRFSPDGRYLVSCGDDHAVNFWTTNPVRNDEFKPVTFTNFISPVLLADFTDDMRHVVAVSDRGRVCVWRWHEGESPDNRLRPIHRRRKYGVKKEESKEGVAASVMQFKEEGDVEPASSAKRGADSLGETESVSDRCLISGWWELLPSFMIPIEEAGRRVRCSAADFHRGKRLLTVGNVSGQLAVLQINLELTAETVAYELVRVPVDGESRVSTVHFNDDGEWIAAGLPDNGGTLCVWEWRSATFVLKENSIDPEDGGVTAVATQSVNETSGELRTAQLLGASQHLMAAGYGDGRVVVWDSVSGFELKRFKEHSGPVTGLCFTNQQHTIVSCSSTGEIKCYELIRMTCFRSMLTPNLDDDESKINVPLGSLSVDGSGSMICAASSGSDCSVFLYSMQTGHLLDRFKAHTSPVVDLKFNLYNLSAPGQLAATCLDGAVCVWDLLNRDAGRKIVLESGDFSSETAQVARPGGFSVAWNPLDTNELAVSLGGSEIVVWNVEEEKIAKRIEGARDLDVGREPGTETMVKSKDFNMSFNRMAYAGADKLIAVSEKSARVYVYDLNSCLLSHSWRFTHNRSLENLLRKLNAKNCADVDFDLSDLDADYFENQSARRREAKELPGARSIFGVGDRVRIRRRLRVRDMSLSADAQELVIGTSHGVFCFESDSVGGFVGVNSSTQNAMYAGLTSFTPVTLDTKTTRSRFSKALEAGDVKHSLKLALRINCAEVIALVYERIEKQAIEPLAKSLDPELVLPMLNFLKHSFAIYRSVKADSQLAQGPSAAETRCSRRLEHHLLWLLSLLTWHKDRAGSAVAVRGLLLAVLKDLLAAKQTLGKLFHENRLTAQYFSKQMAHCE